MEITFTEDYAIRFIVYLAKFPDRVVPRWEISDSMRIPKAFLAKIAQTLENKGLIEIYRGKKGGYKLKKSPTEITLLDVIESIRGKINITPCLENPSLCVRSSFCSLYRFWQHLNERIRHELAQCKIIDLVEKEKEIIKKLAKGQTY
ncbi:MAG: Rrf2 family transcriptional regulator [Thermodesulfobacteriota bacterium]|nr:MAG: Rrf2 family transcriptional regulator [Thermodesulfobacteriota bacterium]RLG13117.1 MAG: Rrf2 family transcriptional regulator [Candidatus Pacearchaeota archaeon]